MTDTADNFLNLHVLVTSAVANANRDDTGAPKQVTYGGVTRHRMSSQAMTRAKRTDFELTASGDQVSWRSTTGTLALAMTMATDLATQTGQTLTDAERTALTAQMTKAVSSLMMNRVKAEKAAAERARAAKAKAVAAGTDTAADGDTDPGDDGSDLGKKDTLTWLAEHEVRRLVTTSLAKVRTGTDPGDFVNPDGHTQALSIAAFGRMFAFRRDLQNEAAVQRSHAFTTHSANIEPDYFTAVDDLPPAGRRTPRHSPVRRRHVLLARQHRPEPAVGDVDPRL